MATSPPKSYFRLIVLVAAALAAFMVIKVSYGGLWALDSLFVEDLPPFRAASPSAAPDSIPKKIWYKLGPNGLNDDSHAWTDSCILNNTAYEVDFMTDATADAYVQDYFNATHPTLVAMYLGLQVPILKADLLRYLLMYTYGGVYMDLDVSCDTPIAEWLPREYESDAGLVVGWEFDMGYGDNIIREFATWAMMAKPRSPHIWTVVEDTLAFFNETMATNQVPIQGITLPMVGDVVDATGPRRFTRGIAKSIEKLFGLALQDFHNLTTPKLAGDVLILPGYAWAASSNKFEDVLDPVPPPLLSHHYAGSWKNDKGGEITADDKDS